MDTAGRVSWWLTWLEAIVEVEEDAGAEAAPESDVAAAVSMCAEEYVPKSVHSRTAGGQQRNIQRLAY